MADRPARGVLSVVATPIGNLGDITLRALETLRTADVVAAEDTRLTRRIWARHGIETPLVSYHARSGAGREAELLARLEAGEHVALVTDAGTPLVSDPGEGLIGAWIAAGGSIVPIPGPSAVLAALVASGIPAPRWSFEGFLPRRGPERRAILARIAADDRATVLFEAPGRTAATLADLAAACGQSRPGALCRELTKRHEEVRRGPLADLAAGAEAEPPRGEVTIVVAGMPRGERAAGGRDGGAATDRGTPAYPGAPVQPSLAEARAAVEALVAAGTARGEAAKQVARESGHPRRALYGEVAGR